MVDELVLTRLPIKDWTSWPAQLSRVGPDLDWVELIDGSVTWAEPTETR